MVVDSLDMYTREPPVAAGHARPNSVHDGILKAGSLPDFCREVERDVPADLLLSKIFKIKVFGYLGNCSSIQPADENLDDSGFLLEIERFLIQKELAFKEGG